MPTKKLNFQRLKKYDAILFPILKRTVLHFLHLTKNSRILKYRRLMKFSFYVNKYWSRRMSDFILSRNPSKFS